MTKAKKSRQGSKRGRLGGQRLVHERQKFWSKHWKDPDIISKLQEEGLPGADLLVLDPGIEYPAGNELEPRLREALEASIRLGDELKEAIRASTLDGRSRKALSDTIQSYGSASTRYGALYVQFELRSIDQYSAAQLGKRRGETRRQKGPREIRLALIGKWIEVNAPRVGSYQELYSKKREITAWLKSHDAFIPADPNKLRADIKEAFNRRTAKL